MSLLLMLALHATPPELGRVPWERNFEAAVERAKQSHKPLLVLFDEVPGCSTVVGFGREVLSDAEVVAAITRDFVPVAVFNNVEGADARVLASFGEPAWNNPVVRVIDVDRKPLAPRFDGPYTREAFLSMLRGVKKLERVTVAAACFWECEARLGSLEAVRASRVGFLNGDEVVEVEFDPSVRERKAFLEDAAKLECGKVVSGSPRWSEKDTKYFLQQSRRGGEALSELEKVRLNARLRR